VKKLCEQRRPTERPGRASAKPRVLTGLARCGLCGPWPHKKKYVLPTPAQAEAVARFVEWATSPASGLAIPRTWIGLAGTKLAMAEVESAAKLKPGVYAHHYFGHADGSLLVLYAWLRLEAGLAPEAAFAEAVRRGTGVRWNVDLADLITAAKKE
jgi:hypothetical protein